MSAAISRSTGVGAVIGFIPLPDFIADCRSATATDFDLDQLHSKQGGGRPRTTWIKDGARDRKRNRKSSHFLCIINPFRVLALCVSANSGSFLEHLRRSGLLA